MQPQRQSVYRREGEATLIEIELREPRQLFHTLDPAPFRERDLDAQAETYLLEAARELHLRAGTRLVIYLPPALLGSDSARSIPAAVGHYFEYRANVSLRQLHRLLTNGAISLLIGLLFLLGCLLAGQLASRLAPSEVGLIAREGLRIIGWVALWRPVEIFLYDWWPLWRRCREHRWLAALPVELRAGVRN